MVLRTPLIAALLGSLLLTTGCSLEPPRASPDMQSRGVRSPHPAVAIAEQMLGKPYRYGGSTPHGFDCSGLVYYAYSKAGYRLPRDSDGQYTHTLPVDPRALHSGDLLFFNIDGKNDHVAIYVGNHRFIHAPSSGKRVSYASLDDDYWRRRLQRAGRLR